MSAVELREVMTLTAALRDIVADSSVDDRLIVICAAFIHLYGQEKQSVLLPADISETSRIPLRSVLLWLKTMCEPRFEAYVSSSLRSYIEQVLHQYIYTSAYNKKFTTIYTLMAHGHDNLKQFGWLLFAYWYDQQCKAIGTSVAQVSNEAFTALSALLHGIASSDKEMHTEEMAYIAAHKYYDNQPEVQQRCVSDFVHCFYTFVCDTMKHLAPADATFDPAILKNPETCATATRDLTQRLRRLKVPAVLPLCGVTGTAPHAVATPMVRPLESYEKVREILDALPVNGSSGLRKTLETSYPNVTVEKLVSIVDGLMAQLPIPQLPTSSDANMIESFNQDVRRVHLHTLHAVLLQYSLSSSDEALALAAQQLLSPRFHSALVACVLDAVLYMHRMFTLYPPFAIRGLRTTPIEYVQLMDVLLRSGPAFPAEIRKHLFACRTYALETLFWVPELYYYSPVAARTQHPLPETPTFESAVAFLSLNSHPMLARLPCFEPCSALRHLVRQRAQSLCERVGVSAAADDIVAVFDHVVERFPIFLVHRHTSQIIALCSFVVLRLYSEAVASRFSLKGEHIGMRLVMKILLSVSPLGKDCFIDIPLNPLAEKQSQVRGTVSTLYPLFLALVHPFVVTMKESIPTRLEGCTPPEVPWSELLGTGTGAISPRTGAIQGSIALGRTGAGLPPRAPKEAREAPEAAIDQPTESQRSVKFEPGASPPSRKASPHTPREATPGARHILNVSATPGSLLRRVRESVRGPGGSPSEWADFNISDETFMGAPVRRFGEAFQDTDNLDRSVISRHAFESKRPRVEESENLMTLADLLMDSPRDDEVDEELQAITTGKNTLPMPPKLAKK